MSFLGLRRFSSTCVWMYSWNATSARAFSASSSAGSRFRCVDPNTKRRTCASSQPRSIGMSSSGNPRIVVITICGRGAANSVTYSTEPRSIQRSMSSFTKPVTISRWRSAPTAPTHGFVSCSRCHRCCSIVGRRLIPASSDSPNPSSRMMFRSTSCPGLSSLYRNGNVSVSRTIRATSSYFVRMKPSLSGVSPPPGMRSTGASRCRMR